MATDAKPQWLHPVSLVFVFAAGIRRHLVPALAALFSATTGSWVGGMIALVFFAGSMAMAVLQYVTLRYRLTDDELIVDEGIIFRLHRTVPVQRIQNIDLLQNLFHRLLGVAEVRVETASGTEPEAVLRVLSIAEFESLRSRVFARKAAYQTALVPAQSESSFDPATTPSVVSAEPTIGSFQQTTGAAPGERSGTEVPKTSQAIVHQPTVTIVALPLRLLVLAGLASNRGTVMFFVGLGVVWQQIVSARDVVRVPAQDIARYLPENIEGIIWVWIALALLIATLLVVKGLSIVWTIMRFYGYTLERAGDDLRVRCGLLTRVSATVRRDRIQFISVHRTLVGRWLKIASIRIETAGGGKEDEDPASTIARQWFLPVIEEPRVAAIIHQLKPGLTWDEAQLDWRSVSPRAFQRMRRRAIVLALLVALPSAVLGWSSGVATAAIVALVGWWWSKRRAQSMRYARTEDGVLFRSGVLTKKCSMAFVDKIQSIKVIHNPFDRRWHMATLSIDTVAAGPAEHAVIVPMLDIALAHSERDALARLASLAVTRPIVQPVAGSQSAN